MRRLSAPNLYGCVWLIAWPIITIIGYLFMSKWWPFAISSLICSIGYYDSKKTADNNEKILNEIVKKTLSEHSRALSVRFKQTVTKDIYGVENREKWIDEKCYFIDNVIIPLIPSSIQINSNALMEEIDNTAMSEAATFDDLYSPTMSGVEYEQYCAAVLESSGWKVRTTRATGDQGVDIIGEIRGEIVVFQCKHYTHPIGNKAVQEVIAGRTFEHVKYAAVISNAPYTLAAKQLAASDGIVLLHHADLYDLNMSRFVSDKQSKE